jgi:hypothetical protein
MVPPAEINRFGNEGPVGSLLRLENVEHGFESGIPEEPLGIRKGLQHVEELEHDQVRIGAGVYAAPGAVPRTEGRGDRTGISVLAKEGREEIDGLDDAGVFAIPALVPPMSPRETAAYRKEGSEASDATIASIGAFMTKA